MLGQELEEEGHRAAVGVEAIRRRACRRALPPADPAAPAQVTVRLDPEVIRALPTSLLRDRSVGVLSCRD